MPLAGAKLGARSGGLAAAVALLTALPALAQPEPQGNPVYMDEWAAATETFLVLPSQLASGNLDGAVRVLQRLLDDEPGRVVATPDDPDLFISVRARVNATLLANPALLARYAEVEEPKAQRALTEPGAGGAERVEQMWLLTPSGLEAALCVAQAHLEAARFDAAWLTLRQLDGHPARTGQPRADAADLLARVARYLDRDEVRDLAQKWTRQAGAGATDLKPEPWPPVASRRGLSPLEPSPAVTLDGMVAKPLWTVSLGTSAISAVGAPASPVRPAAPGEQLPPGARDLWIFPSAAGDTVYANDGATVWAWDRFTLTKRWSASPTVEPRPVPDTSGLDLRRFRGQRSRNQNNAIEDPAMVTVAGRDVVAIMGVAVAGEREGGGSVNAIDAQTGRIRWTVQINDLDPRLAQTSPRGAPMVSEGTVVVAARKSNQAQRLASLSLVGLDQATGQLRWRRLVGSAGALPWGASVSPMIDGGLLLDGIAYRTDQLGVVAAYEVYTGRPVWIRRNDTQTLGNVPSAHPWEVSAPIADATSIVTISPDRREITRLDRQTGRLLGSRPASDFSTPSPDYILRVGGFLATIGPTRIALAPFDTFDQPGVSIRQITQLRDPGIRGRVVVAGSRLIIPTGSGVAVVDPADASGRLDSIHLERPGNVLALPSQLLVADDSRLHSYLLWDEAQRVLTARMEADPSDPGPAGTFAELAYRAGKPTRILPAVDNAVRAIDNAPTPASVEPARRRLFDAILAMLNASQEPDARAGAPEAPGAAAGKLTDLTLLGALVDRLGRIASTPDERASQLLAQGRFREGRSDFRAATEAYQRILQDPSLAAANWTGPQVSLRAELEATWRLERLIQEQGPAVYAVHESQARAELAAGGASPSIESLESVVRRFPVASIVPATWLRIAQLHESADRPQAATAALEAGLRAAGRRSDTEAPLLGQLGGRLARALESRGQLAAAAAVLRQMRERLPRAALADAAGPFDASALLGSITARLAESSRWPRLGQVSGDGAQALPGWTLMNPLRRDITGRAARCFVLENGEEVGIWACPQDAAGGRNSSDTRECTGELTKIWSTAVAGSDASLMCVHGDTVLLFNDTPAGGQVTAVSISRAETAWKSDPFPSLFHADPAPAGDQPRSEPPAVVTTPLDGQVPAASLLWCMDDRTVVLVERAGRAAAFDLQTGRVLWSVRTPVARVFDTDLRDGLLVVAGEQDAPVDAAGAPGPSAILVSFDARTGQIGHRLTPPFGQVRWISIAVSGELLAGMDAAVACFDPVHAQVNWAAGEPNLQATQEAWAIGDRLFVATSATPLRAMWSVSIRDGRAGPRAVELPSIHLDSAQRIYAASVRGPRPAGAATPTDAVAFTTLHGVAVVSPLGELLGVDALGGMDAVLPAQAGDGVLVTAETVASSRQSDGQMDFLVHILDSATARILQSRPVVLGARPRRLAVIDGRIAITAGGSTVILRAPAQP